LEFYRPRSRAGLVDATPPAMRTSAIRGRRRFSRRAAAAPPSGAQSASDFATEAAKTE
jgi:hypothetical protein